MLTTQRHLRHLLCARFLAVGLALLAAMPTLAAQTRVDLRLKQTKLKKQGSRGTCITFSAIAALEAAYMRAGYKDLDLSEEFSNYMGKMNWLHPNWNNPSGPKPRIGTTSSSYAENTLGLHGGGNGTGYVKNLTHWLRVPREFDMPYKSSTSLYFKKPYAWNHVWWTVQQNANEANLDLRNLPRRALTASAYYGAKTYGVIKERSTLSIESALRRGFEVVWDFTLQGTEGSTWQWTKSAPYGAHSMLIVGYDRSDKNSSKHYFICKNSWGTKGARTDGFTYISYEYLQKNGSSASYIASVVTPSPWPELAFLGRWNLSFDGHRGTLDLYHIPGASNKAFTDLKVPHTDRRVGTFRDGSGKMHRVNAIVSGKRIEFWFRGTAPNMSWSDTRTSPYLARRFVYYMIDPKKGTMAGWHHDNTGTTPSPAYGGYARIPSTITGTDGYLKPNFSNSQAWSPNNYIGKWSIAFDNRIAELSIQERNDLLVPVAARSTYYGLQCEFIDAGNRYPFVALVRKTRTADIYFFFNHKTRGHVRFHGYMLSWQRGVFAGDCYQKGSYSDGFYAVRTGTATIPGSIKTVGSGCVGTNGRLTQAFSPAPFLGKKSTFTVTGGPVLGRGLMAIGVDKIASVFPGTKCYLYTNPLMTLPIGYDKYGRFQMQLTLQSNRALLGGKFYTQFAAFDTKANAAGLTLSNALLHTVGGYK